MIEYTCQVPECGNTIEVTRAYVRPGRKRSGWTVAWVPWDGPEGFRIAAFCPRCPREIRRVLASWDEGGAKANRRSVVK